MTDIFGDNLVDDAPSPQKDAFDWLVNEDLDLNITSDRDLIQRYVATVLYFSTNGDGWDRDYGFLGENDVCEWQDSQTRKGIKCDETGAIVDITISKWKPVFVKRMIDIPELIVLLC